MSREFVSVEMANLNSVEAYELLAATVTPRPIAFVSTCSASGIANLAPFSFFMVGGSNPPSLMYSPTLNKAGEAKDSLRNVLETGEFVVNTVHREMAAGMNAASAELAAEMSEWEVSGFSPIPSLVVRPPRVLESLVQFECRLFKVIEHGDGPNAARYVIGEVVFAHLDASIASNPGFFRGISRLAGNSYADLDSMERFDLKRPQSSEWLGTV